MFGKISAIIRKFFNIQFSNKFADIDPNRFDAAREINGQYNATVSKGKIHVKGNNINKLLDEKLKKEREARINNANMRIKNPCIYLEQYERSIRKIISEGDSAVARNLRSIRDVSETADISSSNLKNNYDNKLLQHYGLIDAFEDERLRKEREERINDANMRIKDSSLYRVNLECSIQKIISEGDSVVARNLDNIRSSSVSEGQWPDLSWIDEIRKTSSRHKIPRIKKSSWYGCITRF